MLITDAVLLIDAENAFNSINRKVMLHSLKLFAPSLLVTTSIVMQLHQGYLLLVEEKYFLVRRQLKVTQQLWEHMY